MHVSELIRAVAASIGEGEDLPLAVLPAAVPYFFIRVNAICVERRELDVLQEFALRAIELGFSGADTAAGFLGAPAGEVNGELVYLAKEYFVSHKTPGKFSLTEKGIAAISQHGLQRVKEREAACFVNGVTRRVEQVSEMLVPRRRVPAHTLILPAVPARPPRKEELDVAGVRVAMMAARTPFPRSFEISRLGRIVRATALFQSGHLLLRRGGHSVPIICVHGSADTDLARVLGGHPALQGVKSAIEANEKRVRTLIRNLYPKLETSKLASVADLRIALNRLVTYADSPDKSTDEAKKQFAEAAKSLSNTTHWITSIEWHVLFARTVLNVRQRLLVVAPPRSSQFELAELEHLGNVARAGKDVELIIHEDAVSQVQSDQKLRHVLQNVRLSLVPSTNGWCGFCADGSSLVVGLTRHTDSTMGSYDTFFGAVLDNVPQPEQLLMSCIKSSNVPVVIRSRRKKVEGAERKRRKE